MLVAFQRIADERARQRQLWRQGKLSCCVESPITDDNRKLRVVMEEIGEIARELDQLDLITKGRTESSAAFNARLQKRRLKLHDELTDAAAVLTAWLESFESKVPTHNC